MTHLRRARTLLTVVLAVTVAACAAGRTADGARTSPRPAGASAPASSAAGTPAPDPSADRAPADSPDAAALAEGLNAAGMQLFLAAAEGSTEDVVLSPLSIGVAFGMADVGATGAASEALEALFGYPIEGEARWSAANTLLQQIDAVQGPVVELANRQFPDEGFVPEPAFDEAIARFFGAAAQPLPLQADPEGSRQVVNAYVADRTEDLIPELLPAGFITPDSVLVLVNALYLQADWATPFGKYPTDETADFTLLDGTTTAVALMNDKEVFGPAVEGEGYVAVERPYEGGALSMLVVVPDEGRFEEVQARLAAVGGEVALLQEIDGAASDQSVDLYLPRFTSTTSADLQGLIEGSLGISGIFSADYQGIAPGIELTSAIHAADIAVDEIGTVAAAATALGFEESGPGEPDLVVRADRPFLYAIRHLPTGTVLFVGRVTDPAA